jgi:hypothetical protein
MEHQKITIGTTPYTLPLRASGFYVADANNSIVCECATYQIAQYLAKILNKD